jgi:pyruvate/2-oxoglutarate dehydrogenase complex dihydrolipoamide acyltransferase (E2) component
MQVDVRLPQWGMGISEGRVLEWLKAIGDQVDQDEPLVEIETAKATDLVSAPVSGVLSSIVAAVGDVVPVSELLATIDAAD